MSRGSSWPLNCLRNGGMGTHPDQRSWTEYFPAMRNSVKVSKLGISVRILILSPVRPSEDMSVLNWRDPEGTRQDPNFPLLREAGKPRNWAPDTQVYERSRLDPATYPLGKFSKRETRLLPLAQRPLAEQSRYTSAVSTEPQLPKTSVGQEESF